MTLNEALNIFNLKETDQSEIKKVYKKLSLKYHPDKNPLGSEIMQSINAAYKVLKESNLDNVSHTESEKAYNYCDTLETVLNAIIELDGLDIEVCGNWVWVGGNTKEHKEVLKENKFRWSKNKSKWYFRPEEKKFKKRRYNGQSSMEDIRTSHGSQTVNKANYHAKKRLYAA